MGSKSKGGTMTKEEILQTLREKQNFIKQEFDVDKIGLFGSYAKDKQTVNSDIDFYVEFSKKTFDNLAGLWVYLEELYNKKIDIVYKHSNSNRIFLSRIQQEVIYPTMLSYLTR
jgi:predicted nucleotidyltransferase